MHEIIIKLKFRRISLLCSPITGQPAKPAQRANLSQKYSMFGPLSEELDKAGPSGPGSLLLIFSRFATKYPAASILPFWGL